MRLQWNGRENFGKWGSGADLLIVKWTAGWIGDWFGGMGYVCMMVNEIEI